MQKSELPHIYNRYDRYLDKMNIIVIIIYQTKKNAILNRNDFVLQTFEKYFENPISCDYIILYYITVVVM